MSGLKQLLIDLGKDADLKDEYVKDPKSVMQRYGCTAGEVKAMLDKDVGTLKRMSGLDTLKANHGVQAYDYD
ncbi:MAG: hypothetical protein WD397_12315 [Wenzhouxiangellaceae bacterium]